MFSLLQSLKIMSILLLITVTFSKFSHGNKTNSDLINLTIDFLNLQQTPTKVTSFLCWKQDEIIKFSKALSDENYPNKIIRIKNVTLNRSLRKEHEFFLIDLSCEGAFRVLDEASKLKLFKFPYRWLIFGNSNRLANYYFGVDSQIYVTGTIDGKYGIKSIYKYSENSTNFVSNNMSVWTKIGKFSYFNQLSPLNRSNLMGTTIKISYVITNLDSLNHLWDSRKKRVDAITKANYVLVHHLTDMLNASRKFIMQRTWGYKNPTTGIYSGLIGDLQQGLADLGGTPSFFTLDRIDIVDYIAATTNTYVKFIFRAPPLSYVTNVFTLPFDTTVWHYSFVMVAVIGVVIYIIALWEWSEPEFQQTIEERSDSLEPNIFEVIMLEIGAISQQGSYAEPKSFAGRIATIVTFLVLMFMYTSYSANIVALLQSTTESIRTLEDLLNSRIKLGVEDIVYGHYYFENAKEPTRKAIYEQKIAPKGQQPNFMTVEEGMKRVREGFFGFHVELTTGYQVVSETFQENEKCGLREVVYISLIKPWLSIEKNSVYKKIMKIAMRKMHESGVQQREVQRLYVKKPVCHSKGSNFGSVGLIDCYSAFLIFAVGIVLALTLLIFEILIMRYSLRRRAKENGTITMVKERSSPDIAIYGSYLD